MWLVQLCSHLVLLVLLRGTRARVNLVHTGHFSGVAAWVRTMIEKFSELCYANLYQTPATVTVTDAWYMFLTCDSRILCSIDAIFFCIALFLTSKNVRLSSIIRYFGCTVVKWKIKWKIVEDRPDRDTNSSTLNSLLTPSKTLHRIQLRIYCRNWCDGRFWCSPEHSNVYCFQTPPVQSNICKPLYHVMFDMTPFYESSSD